MGLLEIVRQDVRYALRTMRRRPAFTAIAILVLALGIGGTTAIFSLINALVLRPLPVRDPRQLVEFLSLYPGEPRMNFFTPRVYQHYRDQNHVFSDVIGTASFRGDAMSGEYVTGNFFRALGLQPAIGRLIGPEDDTRGAGTGRVAVLSWPFWQSRFHLDPVIPGASFVVDGEPSTVIGVAPRGFFGLQVGYTPDVWVPAAQARGQIAMKLMARLKPGISTEQALAEMAVLDRFRTEETARTFNDPRWHQALIDVRPASAGLSGLRDQFASQLFILMTILSLLLAIACTNIASLLLARGAARQREMAVRVALGAGRFRLVRQLLTESLLLSGAGGLFGLVVAYVGAGALLRVWRPDPRAWGPQPIAIPRQIDFDVLLFTALVALGTGVLFGLAPAWSAIGRNTASQLREMGGAGETRSRRLFGKSLVVAQVALSVVMLSAAGLFVRHLWNLRNVDALGFRRDSVLLVTLNPQGSGYDRVQLSRRYEELLGRLNTIPGVHSATLRGITPLEGPAASRFVNVEGFQEDARVRRRVVLNWIAPKYFETLGTPLMAGRDFQFEDAGRPRVAIVNQAAARYYFAGSSPLGKRFTFDEQNEPYEIVGVAGDAKYAEIHDPAPRTIYLDAFQEGRGQFSQFSLRTSVAPATVAGDVRRVVEDVLKTVKVAKVTTLAEQVDASIVPERLTATLSGLFGTLGAVLTALGLYGLLAYMVVRRTGEIGVRMALGATGRDVTRMVLKDAFALAVTGLAIGVPIAFWSRRFAAYVLENLSVDTALPVAFAAAGMIAVALVAAYVPARRAARVQPMDALRR